MIRFAVTVTSLDQLETLIAAAKLLELNPELGSVPAEAPQSPRRRQKRSSKGKKKSKRFASHLQVKLKDIASLGKASPKLCEVHQALWDKFGNSPFDKSEAKPYLKKAIKLKHSSGYITEMLRKGAMVPA